MTNFLTSLSFLLLLSWWGLSAGCQSPGEAFTRPAATAEASPFPIRQDQWELTTRAARAEGRVHVFTSVGSLLRPALAEPLKRRSGIELELASGTSAEFLPRIREERKAGLYLWDVLVDGSSSQLLFKDEGLLDRIDQNMLPPEVTDPAAWLDGGLSFLDKDRYIIVFISQVTGLPLYNTDLVKAELRAWEELLQPSWKGKIAMHDPSIPGAGSTFWVAMGEKYGEDYLRKLARQQPAVSRDQRMIVEWIARGKYDVALGARSEIVNEFVQGGVPLKFGRPADYNFTSAGSGLVSPMNRAPHPYAAMVFINWLLTKEGQTAFVRATANLSRRLDVTTEYTGPDKLREPGVKYFDMETEDAARRRFQWQQLARDVFAGP
ncbi:MAG: extracellular solute-binding protein [Chloroflexi bacterium]|nr:extracellular solute-binding protein [Chloroflexota bacterium]